MKMPAKYTVYFYSLYDPRNNKHFYVGQTQDIHTRINSHISASRKGKSKKDERIRKIKDAGLKVGVKIHYTISLDKVDYHQSFMLRDIEQLLINKLLSDNHFLYNKYILEGALKVDRKLQKRVWKECDKTKLKPNEFLRSAVYYYLTSKF